MSGKNNNVLGPYSTITSGINNYIGISGAYSAIIGGTGNGIARSNPSYFSATIAGEGLETEYDYSYAFGKYNAYGPIAPSGEDRIFMIGIDYNFFKN